MNLPTGVVRLALAVAAGLTATSAQAEPLLAGAARIAITPGPDAFPYAASDVPSLNTHPGEKPFVGVHDDLFARALVLAKGRDKLALVVLDVTTVPRAGTITMAVAHALDIAADHVLIVASHTHNAPLFSYAGGPTNPREEREIARLNDGAVAAARAADAALAPALVAFGRGAGYVNINNGEAAGRHDGYDPAGAADHTLDLVRVARPDGTAIALVVNYASHAEVMFRALTRPDGYEVSGDLPGAVARLLEAPGGAAPVALVTPGAEADQLPMFKALQPPVGVNPAIDLGAAGWALLTAQARRLAGSIETVLAAMPAPADVPALSAAVAAPLCPGQRLVIAAPGGTISVTPRPPVAIPLAVLRLGSIALAGVGGDIAATIGEHAHQAAPAQTMIMSMAGDTIGYILSDESYTHPGHGLTKSTLAPHCADAAITRGIAELAGARR